MQRTASVPDRLLAHVCQQWQSHPHRLFSTDRQRHYNVGGATMSERQIITKEFTTIKHDEGAEIVDLAWGGDSVPITYAELPQVIDALTDLVLIPPR